MKLTNSLRTWWQQQTGEDDTPLDGDTPAWAVSMLFHLGVLIAIAMIPLVASNNFVQLTISNTPPEEMEEIEIVLPEDFYHDTDLQSEIGANSVNGEQMALALAPSISEISDVPVTTDVEVSDTGEIEVNETIVLATGPNYSENLAVKGAPVGVGSEGAAGAIDRITHEILLSLDERPTLVVWLFDQSGSLTRQRQAIHDRFDRIYEELGVIEASGNERFTKHEDSPLLTSVIAFGENVSLLTQKPTDNLAEIKTAVAGIQQDDSGIERVFSSIYMAAERYKSYRIPDAETKEPSRNVMLIAVTDEAGDDDKGLEQTIKMCRRYAMPVYVVGVPAPFGRAETMVKWVDPDPEYDQSPQWGRVNQGPESFYPERVKLHFAASEKDNYETPIDSGFGPFSLTRLSYETGGIYFAVHPNRNVKRAVGRGETAAFSAHMEHFFDPQIMRRYRPDYVSSDEYVRRISSNKARGALVKTAQMSWIAPMGEPKTRFLKRSEAEFANELTEAQKESAKLEPKINSLFETIKIGEADRKKEDSLRWQAGYDLAYGRILAVKVRTEGYNAMLAAAKRGLKQQDPKNNTWVLKPANELDAGSQLEKQAEKARTVLQAVVDEHEGTPWALLAQKELDNPVGWKWEESFTDFTPPNQGMGNGNANPANPNNKPVMLKKPPPKRAIPKL